MEFIREMKTTLTCPMKQLCRAEEAISEITVQIAHSVSDINKTEWNDFISADKGMLNTNYLFAAETGNPHIKFRYASIYNDSELIGVSLFQIISVSNGLRIKEIKDPTWKDRVKTYSKKFINGLNVKLLLNGNAFITGDFGYCIKSTANKSDYIAGLHKAIKEIDKEENVNITMIKDFRPEDIPWAQELTKFSFKEVGAQPNMEFDVHWDTFEEYLAALSSKYRTKVKSKLKKFKGLERRALSLEEIEENYLKIHQLYKRISDNAEFNLTFLAADYFLQCKRQLGDKFQIQGYYLDGELIAFMSYFIVNNKLESHFVGYEAKFNNKFAIYHNLLAEHIALAIEKKLSFISYGRTALESKSNFGAKGVELNSFVYSKNMILQAMAKPLFDSMRSSNFVERHPFKEVKK